MTEHIQINDIVPRITYVADGVQSAFTYPFAIFRTDDLEVWLDSSRQADGFSVSGAGITGGGTVLFVVPPSAGQRVTLRRRVVLARTADYQADGLIRAKTLNDEFDYQVAAIQQVADDVERSLRRSPTSASLASLILPEPLASRGLKWNADGTALVNTVHDPDGAGDATQAAADAVAAAAVAVLARDQAVASAASVGDPLQKGLNLADLPDAAAARGNLGLGSGAIKSVGTAAGNLVELDSGGKVPAPLLPPIETFPVGAMMPYAGAAAPVGWLLCDGGTISRTAYAALFAAIGTAFGAGDGSTTFKLPDMRGRAAIGAGQGASLSNRTLGQALGAETHTLTIAEMPSHSHGESAFVSVPPPTSHISHIGDENGGVASGGGQTGSNGGGGAHNNMQPSLAVNFIIKT